jgi:hypothetical protein
VAATTITTMAEACTTTTAAAWTVITTVADTGTVVCGSLTSELMEARNIAGGVMAIGIASIIDFSLAQKTRAVPVIALD